LDLRLPLRTLVWFYFVRSRDAVAEWRRKLLESKREFRPLETSRKHAETP
jgi:hypothetical protein